MTVVEFSLGLLARHLAYYLVSPTLVSSALMPLCTPSPITKTYEIAFSDSLFIASSLAPSCQTILASTYIISPPRISHPTPARRRYMTLWRINAFCRVRSVIHVQVQRLSTLLRHKLGVAGAHDAPLLLLLRPPPSQSQPIW